MAYGYEGEKIRLVPLDIEKHLDNAVRWMNDTDVTEWLLVGDFPITRLAEKDWFEAHMKASQSEATFAMETLAGEHIGFSNLFRIDFRARTAVSGSLIGAKEHWGKGLGSDAARVRARYAFDVLGLATLYSAFLADNDRSRRMQEAAGYREWGRQPNAAWKHGRFHDLVHTYLRRPEDAACS